MIKLFRNSNSLKGEKGFTIVELMIALAVFSTILVIGTVVMIQIGNLYTKGVNTANLQDATRSVANDVASSLQFSGQTPSMPPAKTFSGMTVNSVCIGSTRFSYIIGKKLGQDTDGTPPTKHVLWRDTVNSALPCTVLDITQATPPGSVGGYEMVPDNVRLNKFSIVENPPNSGVFTVQVWMSYGDIDLMTINPSTGSVTCKGGAGTQFCAASELTTQVSRRVE